ncbi:MAG: 5'-deoxynucleotidase [Firmicutes bacterium]|nr:5'-deoxynucleotidase [Bacillota bacterium]
MYSFYAFLSRMKYISRWGLMKSLQPENVAEHSLEVALIAHALAIIENRVFGKALNADRVGMTAVFHDVSEVLTGDLPTPVKYFSSDLAKAYKSVEADAADRLLKLLPDEIKGDIACVLDPPRDTYEFLLVKCADKLAAYVKCIEELRSFNNEFKSAEKSTKAALDEMAAEVPSVRYFMDNFIGMYYKNLDELM